MFNSLLDFSKSPILNFFFPQKEFEFIKDVKQYIWKSKKYGISLIIERVGNKRWQVIIKNKDNDVQADEELKNLHHSLTIAKSFLNLWNNEVLPFVKSVKDFEVLKCAPTTKSRQKLFKRAGFQVKETKGSYNMYMNVQ